MKLKEKYTEAQLKEIKALVTLEEEKNETP